MSEQIKACKKCKSTDIKFIKSTLPSKCDYLACRQCKSSVSGYGEERLIQLWNMQQK